MDAIYLVCGRSGEYSDKCDWNVKAFERKEDAHAFRDLLQAKVNSIESAIRNFEEHWDYEREKTEKDKINDLDSNCQWYCGEGGYYRVEEIPFVQAQAGKEGE